MKTFKKRYVVDERGTKKEVIIPVEEYDNLIEDLHDLAVIAERKDERPISRDELLRRINRHE